MNFSLHFVIRRIAGCQTAESSNQISVNSLKEALLESEVKEAAGNKSTWQIIQCSERQGLTKQQQH